MGAQLDFLLQQLLKSSIGCSSNHLDFPRRINVHAAIYITILPTTANGLQELGRDLRLQFSLYIFGIGCI